MEYWYPKTVSTRDPIVCHANSRFFGRSVSRFSLAVTLSERAAYNDASLSGGGLVLETRGVALCPSARINRRSYAGSAVMALWPRIAPGTPGAFLEQRAIGAENFAQRLEPQPMWKGDQQAASIRILPFPRPPPAARGR